MSNQTNKRNFELNKSFTQDVRGAFSATGWFTDIPPGYRERFTLPAASLVGTSDKPGMSYLRKGGLLNTAIRQMPHRIIGWQTFVRPIDAASYGIAINLEQLLYHVFISRLFQLPVLYIYRIYYFAKVADNPFESFFDGGFWLTGDYLPKKVVLWLCSLPDYRARQFEMRRLLGNWLPDMEVRTAANTKEPFVVLEPSPDRKFDWQALLAEYLKDDNAPVPSL